MARKALVPLIKSLGAFNRDAEGLKSGLSPSKICPQNLLGSPKPGILGPLEGQSVNLRIVIAALIAAVILAAGGLWLYSMWVESELDDIRAQLVTEAQLEHPDAAETISGIKLAPVQCARVYDLRLNPISRRLEGDEIRAMWAHCEKIADMVSGLDKIETKLPE